MIFTVTLNPTVDRSLDVDRVVVGDTNRVTHSQTEPGGKGINVSRVARVLGVSTIALGFVSGSLGRFVEHALNEQGIQDDFIHTPGQTRTNTIVVDHAAEIHTTYAEQGPQTAPRYLDELIKRLRRRMKSEDWVVISGSLPPGIPAEAYARILAEVRRAGARGVLDADGQVLKLGLASAPELIKPNRQEMERLIGRPLPDDAAVIAAAREVQAGGIGHVIVSLGVDGSVAVGPEGAWRARSPQVPVVSAVGAGDSLVAGLVIGLSRGDPLPDALRLGTACGAATTLTSGTELCHRHDIERLLPEVTIDAIPPA